MPRWNWPRRPAWPETIVAGPAALNFLHVAWEESNTPGGCLVCPWYYPWEWTNIPTRLLAAALLLLVAHWSSRALAILIASLPFLLVMWFFFSPERLPFFMSEPESLLSVQGVVAVAVLSCGAFRLLARALRRPILRTVLAGGYAVVLLGYVSSALGASASQDQVARWIAREALGGRSFHAWEGVRGWGDSLSVFRRVGADVHPTAPYGADEGKAQAMIWPARCPLPFVARVQYTVRAEGDAWPRFAGEWVFLAGPGLAKRLPVSDEDLRKIDWWVLDVARFPWSRWSANII